MPPASLRFHSLIPVSDSGPGLQKEQQLQAGGPHPYKQGRKRPPALCGLCAVPEAGPGSQCPLPCWAGCVCGRGSPSMWALPSRDGAGSPSLTAVRLLPPLLPPFFKARGSCSKNTPFPVSLTGRLNTKRSLPPGSCSCQPGHLQPLGLPITNGGSPALGRMELAERQTVHQRDCASG